MIRFLLLVLAFLSPAFGAIATENARQDYVGSGSVAAYAFTFPVQAATELRVFRQSDAAGTEAELVYNTDYTVALGSDGTGTVTLTAGNLTNAYKLSIQRGVPYTQTYNPGTAPTYNAAALGRGLDRLQTEVARLKTDVARSIKIPYTEAGGDTVTKLTTVGTARRGQGIIFDASGNAIVGGAVSSGVAASAFMQTVLDDTTAGAALTTLGIANTKAMFANVKDYGALGNDSADDTAAIQAAINATGRVWFPAGTYRYTALTLPVNTVLQGVQRKLVSLKYMGTGKAIALPASSVSRCEVIDLTITAGVPGSGKGISFHNSSFNHVDKVLVEGFNIGVEWNDGTGGTFSARNSMMRFEVNTCNIGVQARVGTNVNSMTNGRVWNCFNSGNGIGLDIADAASFFGHTLNIESCDTCLKVRTSTGSFFNLYTEKGAGTKDYDIDAVSILDTGASTANGGGGVALFEGDEKRLSSLLTSTYFGAGFSGPSAGHRQYIKNPDMSRGLNAWAGTSAPTVVANTVDYKTGGKSYDITATAAGSYYATTFTLEGDIKRITVCVRFKNITSADFKINVYSGAVLVGQSINPTVSSGWETRAITCDITDPTQTISVRIYPDATSGVGQIRLDAAWAVRGAYAVAQRNYKQGIEILATPQSLVSGTVAANQGTSVRTPTDIPSNAVGCILRVKVNGTQSSTYATYVNVQNGGTLLANVESVVSGRGGVAEIHCQTTTPSTGLIVTNAANSVTYSVELIAWILEE